VSAGKAIGGLVGCGQRKLQQTKEAEDALLQRVVVEKTSGQTKKNPEPLGVGSEGRKVK